MLAEKTRTRTPTDRNSGFDALRNPADKFTIPDGTALRYAEAQQDVPHIAESQGQSGPSRPRAAGRTIRGGRALSTVRWTQGETALITALLACTVVVCALGVIYVAAYMNVAYQGRQIHNLQAELTAETARQHALINDIGWKESPNRIAQRAEAMGMVMGGKADYIVVHTSAARDTANSNTATLAVTSPGMGTGTLGDN